MILILGVLLLSQGWDTVFGIEPEVNPSPMEVEGRLLERLVDTLPNREPTKDEVLDAAALFLERGEFDVMCTILRFHRHLLEGSMEAHVCPYAMAIEGRCLVRAAPSMARKTGRPLLAPVLKRMVESRSLEPLFRFSTTPLWHTFTTEFVRWYRARRDHCTHFFTESGDGTGASPRR